MSYEVFLVVEVLLMCFLSFLMGSMWGYGRGCDAANKIWSDQMKKF